ncbi:MAG: response regulator transcription factor [Chlorobium sp.]|nr:MAG: response regulator transcription factor [Chlorobium sp.]
MRKRKTYKEVLVIADIQFLITVALKAMLTSAGYRVFVAQSRETLEDLLQKKTVSLVITDHTNFFNGSTKELTALKRSHPETAVLVLTGSVSKSRLKELDGAGISNIAMKSDDRDEILRAVKAALKEKKHYSPELLDLLLKTDKQHTVESLLLTSSEIDLIQALSREVSLNEIAIKKKTTSAAVDRQLKKVFRKLGVTDQKQLIAVAVKSGLIDSIEYYI